MMMEEVSDDTNGDFEIVQKSDDNGFKDTSTDDKQDSEVQSQAQPSYPPPNVSQPAPFVLPSAPAPSTEAQLPTIPFYDPTQYKDSNVLMAPFPVQPDVATPPSPPAQQYSYPEHSAPVTAAIPPISESQPPPNPTYMDPNASHYSVPLPGNYDCNPPMSQQENKEGGSVWGWIKNTPFLNRVAEKAKSSVDTVITTLDPGMKEIINTGGDISIVVTSGNETKISAVREAFQLVFGKAVVEGVAVQASSIAPQPVGFSAGLKAAEERINNLRQQGFTQDHQVILAVENFITELTPENWFDIGCLLLQDYSSGISLQVYTEAIPISSHFVSLAKDQTPADYPLGWSGHAVTIGQIIGSALGVPHSEWHQAMTGVSRREILFLAAKTLAGMYKAQLGR